MSEIFFTSDTHFFHQQDFCYGPRGYSNELEMNEGLVEKWNSVVKPNDMVYHLGDVFMGHYDVNLLKRLNGIIIVVRGNHDTDRKIDDIYATGKVAENSIHTSELIKFGKTSLFLCHYPVLTANYDDRHFSQHVINLHGHTHQTVNFLYPNNPFMYHVGVDSHNGYPVNIEEIMVDIRQRWQDLQTLHIPLAQPLYVYPMGAE